MSWRRAVPAGVALLVFLGVQPRVLHGQAPLAVAAASDLQAVLPTIAERYRQSTGQAVRLSFGSSGQFVTQIQNGAPFDLFLSADSSYAERLIAGGYAVRGSLTAYATGRLALWSRTDRGLDLRRGLEVLADARVRRVAIANPDHAPYGRAAVAALERAGLADAVRPKLVLGENVSQAAQFAQTGNADAGLIALSLALSPALRGAGAHVELPEAAHPALRQAGVVLVRSPHGRDAARFLAFLRSAETAALLQRAGFGVAP